MKRLLYILLLLNPLLTQHTTAQSASSFENAGDKAMKEGQPYNAMLYYLSALENKKNDAALSAKAGMAATQCQSYPKGESLLLSASKNEKTVKKFPELLFWLGTCMYYNDKDADAQKFLQQYLNSKPSAYSKEAQQLLTNLKLQNTSMDSTAILNKEDNKINSEYSDFAPVVKGDTLFYSSLRFNAPKDDHQPPRVFARPMYSIAKFKSKLWNPLDPKNNKHTAHTSWTTDQQYLIYTECEYDKSDKIHCQLLLKAKDKKGKWAASSTLPAPFNQKGYTSTQPNWAYESSTGHTFLYFVSDMPNGKGGLDVWRCRFDNGKFSNLENLTAINTDKDDVTPFWSDSTQTLFFSTKGHGGTGGFDVFKSPYSQQQFQAAQPLSLPYNSKFDDLYFITNTSETEGYLSSNRPGSFYLDKNNQTCCYDLYHFKKAAPKKYTVPAPTPPPVVTETPVTETIETSPPPIQAPSTSKQEIVTTTPTAQTQPKPTTETVVQTPVPVEDNPKTVTKEATPINPSPKKETTPPPTSLNTLLPIKLYFDNDQPDQDNINDVTPKYYRETNLLYAKKAEEFVQHQINPIEAEKTVYDFFENEVKGGLDRLETFTELLYQKLKQGEKVEVFVQGFTSPRAETDYNLHLANRRIASIKNHFLTWRYGVLQKYLHSSALVLSEKPLGETTAPSDINDDLDNLPASVYDLRASRERRVEIVEVR